MIIPFPCITLLDADGLYVLKGVFEELTGLPWSAQENIAGRRVFADCHKTNWPHFKAYFEQLGWEVIPEHVTRHSGYVETAIIKPKPPQSRSSIVIATNVDTINM